MTIKSFYGLVVIFEQLRRMKMKTALLNYAPSLNYSDRRGTDFDNCFIKYFVTFLIERQIIKHQTLTY